MNDVSMHVLKRGLRAIYAAEVLSDTEAGIEYGTPFHLMPAGEMTRNTDNESSNVWLDNTVFATFGKEAATDVQITGAALRPALIAHLTGKEIDEATGAIIDAGEYSPKYFAVGGETDNTDGTAELFWFSKGTFLVPEQADKTQDESTDYNGMTLNYSAVRTKALFARANGTKKTSKRVVIDTVTSRVKSGQEWTKQVVTPANLAEIVEKIPTEE